MPKVLIVDNEANILSVLSTLLKAEGYDVIGVTLQLYDHGAALAVDASAAPSVRLQVIPLDDGSYNVRVQTMNFTFAPQNVGQAPEPGEGHAHLYVDDEKIARLERHFEHVTNVHVILSVEKKTQKAEATVHIAGADVFADSVHEDMYAAIDALIDKLDRQVLRHKEKVKSHRGNGNRESIEAAG